MKSASEATNNHTRRRRRTQTSGLPPPGAAPEPGDGKIFFKLPCAQLKNSVIVYGFADQRQQARNSEAASGQSSGIARCLRGWMATDAQRRWISIKTPGLDRLFNNMP